MRWTSHKGAFEIDLSEEALHLFQPDLTLNSNATFQTNAAAFGAFGLQNGTSEPSTDVVDGAGGTGGTSTSVAASSSQSINGLLSGLKWSNSAITYTDPDGAFDY